MNSISKTSKIKRTNNFSAVIKPVGQGLRTFQQALHRQLVIPAAPLLPIDFSKNSSDTLNKVFYVSLPKAIC